MQGVCEKCSHREGCKVPCRPVELYLAQDNLTVFEKTGIGENGEEITIIFAQSDKFIRESELPQVSGKTGEPIEVFTTEAESPFAGFNPDLKQTGIFIDRFFNKWSYKDLAVKYDTTVEGARKIYQAALKRLQAVIEALDGGKEAHNFEPWKKMVEERSGSFPKGVRWYLLNKLFQMRPAEIARMEGVKNPQGVRGMIIRVRDQLTCGEISLFEKDPEEAEAATARFEAERKQRRERYAARRGGVRVPLTHEEKLARRRERDAKNRDRRNARDRERYANNKDQINARRQESREKNRDHKNALERARYALKKENRREAKGKAAGEIRQE
jgi:hypothetical protein